MSDAQTEGAAAVAALKGMRVLSLGAFVAGNGAAQLLADLGADVVKIEPRGRPEVLRQAAHAYGAPAVEPTGVGNTLTFATITRGLRNLAIDLRIPEVRPMFLDLVSRADLLIENFAGPTLQRWGYGADVLHEANPRLVTLSLSGFGRTGPRAEFLAYAGTICNYTGLSAAWTFTHQMQSDYIAAVTAALAGLSAVTQARRSDSPVLVDAAQIDAMAPVLAPVLVGPLNDIGRGEWEVNGAPGSELVGVFACAGLDQWLALELEDIEDWNIACRFFDRPELSVPDVEPDRSGDGRVSDQARMDLQQTIENWCRATKAQTCQHLLQRAGLAAGAVQSGGDIWRDPQLRERKFPERVRQADLGERTYPGSVQRWAPALAAPLRPPPRLGEHTDEVLDAWLGSGAADRAHRVAGEGVFDLARWLQVDSKI